MRRTIQQRQHETPQSRWARLVSDVLSPPVVWAMLAFPMAAHDEAQGNRALLWAGVYSLLVCLLPVIYIAWNVRKGNITDLHMQVREERIRPFVVTLIGTGLAFGILMLIGAPRLMPYFALFTLIQLTVMTAITFIWQISIHSMSITGAVVAT